MEPRIKATANPALNASPAAVVSTAFTEKAGMTLFRLISLGDQATARSQLQQDVLGTTIQEMRCRCIVALVAILNVGLKQCLGFSFVRRNPSDPAKQRFGKAHAPAQGRA